MTLPRYLYFIPFFLSISAFVLLFVGTACDYVQFTSTEAGTDPTSGESNNVSINFGIWYYQSWTVDTNSTSTVLTESCTLYPSSVNVDKNWRAAAIFSLIAIIIGGSVIMLDIFQGCLSTKQNKSFPLGIAAYMICCISAGFSLLMLDSNVCKNNTLIAELNERLDPTVQFQETCSMSQGGKSTIAATVLWFAAAAVAALLHPAHKKEEQSNNNDGLDEPLFNDSTVV